MAYIRKKQYYTDTYVPVWDYHLKLLCKQANNLDSVQEAKEGVEKRRVTTEQPKRGKEPEN